MKRSFRAAVALGIAGGFLIPGLASASADSASTDSSSLRVLATGLHNPRGLALADETLYVAQAGLGGGDPSVAGFGYTGSLSAIHLSEDGPASISTVVDHLPSAAMVEDPTMPPDIVGLDGISTRGGKIYGIFAGSNAASGLTDPLIGRVVQISKRKGVRAIADAGAFGLQWTKDNPQLDPGGQFPDANPYGILADRGGRIWAIDSGANLLESVARDGTITPVAWFPNTAHGDIVPTCVTKGPDGALYIGTLAFAEFFGFNTPSATVFRVDPAQANPGNVTTLATEWATGLPPTTGCSFGRNGTFYASLFIAGVGPTGPFGEVLAIPSQTHTDPTTYRHLATGQLHFPGGIVASGSGVYVADNSTSATDGRVVRISDGHPAESDD
jgi:hypothetical protein